jgi:hypothetical protein
VPRTREGYYHFTGGLAAATKRVAAFAPHADLLWLETKTPDLAQARKFAREVRAQYPNKCVAVCVDFNGVGSWESQTIRVQPESELQLGGARLHRRRPEGLCLGARQGRVRIIRHPWEEVC